jgi:hypothetical protein
MNRKPILTLGLGLVAIGLTAGAAAAQPPHGVYVGRVAGSQAFVAVAVGHGKARAYLCDNGRLAVWYPAGKLHDGRVVLRRRGDTTRRPALGGRPHGLVALPDGSVHPFLAERAGGSAGLYRAGRRAGKTTYLAGWILLRGGAQRGATEHFINPNSGLVVQPAPELDPEAASIELAAAGTVAVVKLGDSFVDKTNGK